MVKTPTSARSGSPATAGGRSSARPRSADAATKATASTPRSVKFDRVGDRDHGSGVDDDGSEDEVEMKDPAPMLEDEDVDELTVVVGKSGAPRPIARRLDAELGEVTPAKVLAPDERPITGSRPPVNGDTPNAYKILGQVGRSMVATSAWVMMFAPKEVGGAKWVTLEKELASPIDSSSLFQLSEQTKRLLVAMGFECTSVPSKVALEVWELVEVSAELTKWKRKLKDSFGVRGTTTVRKLDDVDPSLVPLPTTPRKASAGYQMQTPDTKQVFSKTPDSPYFADSHMVTPKKNSRGRRFNPPALAGDDDDDDDDDDTGYDFADPCEDLTAQIRRSYQREDEDGAQRVKLTHHISLNKLTRFSGTRNRSERSLRWLKKFIYEMEGTNTPQDRWCEPFQLLMESGASNWVRQLPKKTRNKWSLLCEAFMAYYCSQHDQSAEDRYYTATRDEGEHICDYLLRLNGYARSAKIAYEAGGTAGARHVKRFLDTCEDDALVRQLIPQRFDSIAKVEAVINDTMAADRRRKDKGSTRKPTRDGARRTDNSRRDDRRADRDDRRGGSRSRREDRYGPQVTVAGGSADELYDTWQERMSLTPRRRVDSDDYSDGSNHSDRSYNSEYESDHDYMDVAETGRSVTTQRSDGQGRTNVVGDGRRDEGRRSRWNDQERRGRPEYGPCAACGDPRHSVHRCFRRCKFCTQVHGAGQCEHHKLYEEAVKFLKSKHDKDSLPSELQGIFSSNLNERARQL